MRPWLAWTLAAVFLAGLLVIQFIPDAEDSPATHLDGATGEDQER